MAFAYEYGLFLLKTLTIVAGIVAVIAVVAAIASRGRAGQGRDRLELRRLNDHLRSLGHRIEQGLARGRQATRELARRDRQERRALKQAQGRLPRLFVLDFNGDLRASAVESLREEISAVLMAARDDDEVLLRLESPGGMVHSYGFAASQLARLRQRRLRLTVAVDRVAASGGYLMAVVADRIVAAPFAIVGSIGVVGQVPNLHRLLEKLDIDYELHTAGEHKRTLTVFGENTEEGRRKFREELEDIHRLFKDHIARFRPNLDLERVATGEYWLGERARELGLVDDLGTSDDLLLERRERMEIVALKWRRKPQLRRRLSIAMEALIARLSGSP
jgi:serine protease SohB